MSETEEGGEGARCSTCSVLTGDLVSTWVGCDRCDRWYHTRCLGLPNDVSLSSRELECAACKPRQSHWEQIARWHAEPVELPPPQPFEWPEKWLPSVVVGAAGPSPIRISLDHDSVMRVRDGRAVTRLQRRRSHLVVTTSDGATIRVPLASQHSEHCALHSLVRMADHSGVPHEVLDPPPPHVLETIIAELEKGAKGE